MNQLHKEQNKKGYFTNTTTFTPNEILKYFEQYTSQFFIHT